MKIEYIFIFLRARAHITHTHTHTRARAHTMLNFNFKNISFVIHHILSYVIKDLTCLLSFILFYSSLISFYEGYRFITQQIKRSFKRLLKIAFICIKRNVNITLQYN